LNLKELGNIYVIVVKIYAKGYAYCLIISTK